MTAMLQKKMPVTCEGGTGTSQGDVSRDGKGVQQSGVWLLALVV
jgi:hypothetical protein